MSINVSPISRSERIELIDALRGLAIFGILMVNMPLMYEPITQMLVGASQDIPLHQIVSESFIKFFFEGKFYVIFSIMFGVGFWIFLNKVTPNGSSIIPLFRRRLFFLLLFGIAHVLFLWAGDILIFYALFGFILILFKNASDKKITRWAIAFALIPTILTGLMVAMFTVFSQIPEAQSAIEASMEESMTEIKNFLEKASSVYAEGSFSEMISIRIDEYVNLLPGIIFFYPLIFGMFLFGFLFARKRLITDYVNNLSFFRKVFWWGVGVGIVANTLYTIAFRHTVMSIPDGWMFLFTAMHTFGGVAFGLSYISAMVIIFAKYNKNIFQRLLAPVGRMSLTNYLLHSIITAFLFHSYGLGLFGKVEVWQGIVLTVIIFSAQIVFSRWWLNKFRFGPFEWLWRCLTYGKIQPLRYEDK
ncbi:MAG: DUF418 domain-containing protein [Bacteroidales bacterium]